MTVFLQRREQSIKRRAGRQTKMGLSAASRESGLISRRQEACWSGAQRGRAHRVRPMGIIWLAVHVFVLTTYPVRGQSEDGIRERGGFLDRHGRRFTVDREGKPAFNPLDGNWFPVVADSRDADLHLAEAGALYHYGLKEEAFYLWKAIRAMLQNSSTPSAALSQAASQATQRLNHLTEREHNFVALDQLTDPFPYYEHRQQETRLLSDRAGYRLYLPGKWRFQRKDRKKEVSKRAERLLFQQVYLKQEHLILRVSSCKIRARQSTLAQLIAFWDGQQGLLEQQKRIRSFQRKPAADHKRYCQQERRGDCALLQSRWRDKKRNYRQRWEYYHLQRGGAGGRGLILELQQEDGKIPPLSTLRYLLDNLHLSSI